MSEAKDVISAIGRRKCASARVRLMPGTGKIVVNKRAFEEYFTTDAVRGYVMQPLVLVGKVADFDIFANIDGGGVMGQAGALRHGIARALEKFDASLRAVMKPIPTLMQPLHSVDIATKQAVLASKERSDVCAVSAASVVGEAMTALVVAAAVTEKFGGDAMGDVLEEMRAYQARLQQQG